MKTDDDMKKPCSEGKRCWCSDKYGIQIPGTDTWPDKREIDCETGEYNNEKKENGTLGAYNSMLAF